mmetsp:Transcript_44203/g.104648  ORF Transcript_44203/g.104648 Transcript_44203/m.104648 type:complete len:153 (-) Transcript_44203:22-480(-)
MGGVTPILAAEVYQVTVDLIAQALYLSLEDAVFAVLPWRVKSMQAEKPGVQLQDLADRLTQAALSEFLISGHGACRDDAFAVTASMLHIATSPEDVGNFCQLGDGVVGLLEEADCTVGARFRNNWNVLKERKREGELGNDWLQFRLLGIHST